MPERSPTATTVRRVTAAYRRWYGTLPPGVQLVGLQLWLPAVFIVLFCLCYIEAFHAPTVHDAPVAVVAAPGSGTVADLGRATGTAFDYRTVPTADAAADAVRSGHVIGAVVRPDAPHPVLLIASAHQFQAATIASTTLGNVFGARNRPLDVRDLAPLPPHDSYGMTAMYLMLTWCIGGYMVAMFIGLMGAPLRHLTRVGIIVGGAVFVSVLSNVLAGPVIGAVQGHFWELVAIAIGWLVTIGLAVNGLSYFSGRFVALPAITIFVFLSVPASGVAYPTWMLPSAFAGLQPYVVGSGMSELIKYTLYGVGDPYPFAIFQMIAYAGTGIILMLIGKPWYERRERRRALAGRTTMMADAQSVRREQAMAARDKVLAAHGATPEPAPGRVGDDQQEFSGDPITNYGRAFEDQGDSDSGPTGTDGDRRRTE